jgi:hypothetical protein
MSGIFTSITKFVRGALTSSYQVDVVKEGKPLSVKPNPNPTPNPKTVLPKKPSSGDTIF